jgi:hypothetical protein
MSDSQYAVYLGLNAEKKHTARLEDGSVVILMIPWGKFALAKDLKVDGLISVVFTHNLWYLDGV